MIVYVTSSINANLFQHVKNTYMKRYIRQEYDLGDFMKEEYVNLLNMRPEKIIIDELAIKDFTVLDTFQKNFSAQVIILVKENSDIEYPCKTVVLNQKNIDDVIEEIFQVKEQKVVSEAKIGIISNRESDSFSFALRLLSILSKSIPEQLCLVEVGETSYAAKYEKEYNLKKEQSYYLYHNIPVIYNAALEKAIKVFVFLEDNEMNRKRFHACDYGLCIDDGKVLFGNQQWELSESDEKICSEIFQEDFGFVIETDCEDEINHANMKTRKKTSFAKRSPNRQKNFIIPSMLQHKKMLATIVLMAGSLLFVGMEWHKDSRKKELKHSVQQEVHHTSETTNSQMSNVVKETEASTKNDEQEAKESKTTHDITTQQEKITTSQSRKTTEKQKVTTEKPKSTTAKPKATTAHAKVTTEKPKTTEKTTTENEFQMDYDVN